MLSDALKWAWEKWSAIIEKLTDIRKGYDHAARIETLRGLFETVDALREWKVENAGNCRI